MWLQRRRSMSGNAKAQGRGQSRSDRASKRSRRNAGAPAAEDDFEEDQRGNEVDSDEEMARQLEVDDARAEARERWHSGGGPDDEEGGWVETSAGKKRPANKSVTQRAEAGEAPKKAQKKKKHEEQAKFEEREARRAARAGSEEEEEEEEEEDAAIVDWREKHAAASAIWAASPEGERPSRSKNCKKRLLFNSITNWDAGCPLG